MMSYLGFVLKPARSYVLLVMVCVFATVAMGCDCTGSQTGSGGEDNDGLQSAILFQLKVEGPNDLALKDYNITVTWHGELLSASGNVGNANPFDITQGYSGTIDTQGDYVVQQLAGQQRPGTWRFRVSADGWVAECQQTLPADQLTAINFTYLKPGCTNGVFFP